MSIQQDKVALIEYTLTNQHGEELDNEWVSDFLVGYK